MLRSIILLPSFPHTISLQPIYFVHVLSFHGLSVFRLFIANANGTFFGMSETDSQCHAQSQCGSVQPKGVYSMQIYKALLVSAITLLINHLTARWSPSAAAQCIGSGLFSYFSHSAFPSLSLTLIGSKSRRLRLLKIHLRRGGKGDTEAAGERTAEGAQEVRAQPPQERVQGLRGRQHLSA